MRRLATILLLVLISCTLQAQSARDFESGSAESLQWYGEDLNALEQPLSMFVRARAESDANAAAINVGNQLTRVFSIYRDGSGNVIAYHQATGAGSATATTTVAAETWFSAAGVFDAADSRTVYLDGGNSATDTTSVAAVGQGIRTLDVGRIDRTGSDLPWDGEIAVCCWWSSALTADDVKALHDGIWPDFIPADQVAICELTGDTVEADRWGGHHFTVQAGTPPLVEAPNYGPRPGHQQ